MYLCSNKKKEYAKKYKRMDTIRLGSVRIDFSNSAGIYQLFYVEDARRARQRALYFAQSLMYAGSIFGVIITVDAKFENFKNKFLNNNRDEKD